MMTLEARNLSRKTGISFSNLKRLSMVRMEVWKGLETPPVAKKLMGLRYFVEKETWGKNSSRFTNNSLIKNLETP
jgi:hypothetical protein